jgi:hypothetical protein
VWGRIRVTERSHDIPHHLAQGFLGTLGYGTGSGTQLQDCIPDFFPRKEPLATTKLVANAG